MSAEEPRIVITDLGHARRVELFGCLYAFDKKMSPHLVFETTYSEPLIRLIARNESISGVKNTIDRECHPDYVLGPMRLLVTRFVNPERTGPCEVLDYGCGAAATSVNLARILPQARITGVDINPRFIEIGQALIAELGMANRVTVSTIELHEPLPLPPERFDIVMCGGVIEHIHPRRRAFYLGQMWRVLRTGGRLFIRDTPNRFFPFDGHTSWLPFVHWLPLKLGAPLARALSRRKLADNSNETLIDRGFVGVTYHEVLRCIRATGGRPVDLTRTNRQCVNDFFHYWVKKETGRRRLVKLAIRAGYHLLARLLRPLGVPIAALLPTLTLCIRKEG